MHLNFFDHTRLGPDPEPYGERFERIMERMLENQRASRETAGQSSHCPLELAFGRRRNCTGSPCIFYRVPRVRDDCAVREWAPEASRDRELASWFVARREDAAVAPVPDDPRLVPVHELPTAGPGGE